MPYRRSPDTASGKVVTCRIAGRRIACGTARRPIACRHVRSCPLPDRVRYGPSPDRMPSHPGPPRRPHVSAMLMVGRTERPSSAMPRPNMACSRRRQPLCTNIYSFTWPWRSITARSAARLRRGVGPLASRKAGAGQTCQPDIIKNNRTSSEHHPGISGHFRAFPGIVGYERLVACGIVRCRSCRPVWPVAVG